MCVIVHQPSNGHLDKETCNKLWKANPDGGGFAYVNQSDNIIVTKSMEFPAFWRAFETARSHSPQTDFLIHMRVATHGSVCIENVHPFKVDDHTVMAHNGIIHGVPDYKDDRTDTAIFIAEVLPELPPNWLDSSYLFNMVEEWLDWSKLMFITNSPALNHRIYRLGDWMEWEDGLLLTNLSGLITKQPKAPTNQGVSYFQDTSTSWDAWDKFRDEQADMLNCHETEWESDLALSTLKADRLSMQIKHEIIIESNGDMACYGCNKVIDLYTAECECWEMICVSCWNFVARCTTLGNCLTASHVLYTKLNTKELANVRQEVTKTSRGLALVPTKGATNMIGTGG